jgi:prepilin-type N-terminal cleavage/methylation domain-containing protein
VDKEQNMRRGLTLLEVLISMLIISVGILGLLALLPLAQNQAARGLASDRAAACGQNAVADFNARLMHDPATWCQPGGGAAFVPAGAQGFCIDPMFAARHGATTFPDATVAGLTAMPRISLRSSLPSGAAMPQAMADYVFSAHDDLIFDPSGTVGVPPSQQLGAGGAVRQTTGQFSWMATMTQIQVGPGKQRAYQCCIAVFNNRLWQRGEDRVGQIAAGDFYSGGISGGDVRVSFPAGVDSTIKKGQWVVLTPQGGIPAYQWYRVVDTAADADTSGAMERREITLDGADWSTDPQWVVAGASRTGFATPFVIIPPDVATVYTRTVESRELSFTD